MNFTHIRAFHWVATEGGIARAAHVLGVSQSSLSQQIRALEDRHSLRLFEKKGRRLVLTESGQAFLEVTKRLMAVMEEARQRLDGPSNMVDGHLSIMSDSTTLAVELMHRFGARYPSVSMSLGIASLDRISEAVREGQADVGIAMNPRVGNSIMVEPLLRERFHLLMARDHRLAGYAAVAFSDLAGETIIMREKGSRTHAFVRQMLQSEGVERIREITIRERSAIREAVSRGMGVAFFVLSEVPPDNRLACRPLISSRARLDLDEYLLIRADRRRKPVVAGFRAVVADFIRENPRPDSLVSVRPLP